MDGQEDDGCSQSFVRVFDRTHPRVGADEKGVDMRLWAVESVDQALPGSLQERRMPRKLRYAIVLRVKRSGYFARKAQEITSMDGQQHTGAGSRNIE